MYRLQKRIAIHQLPTNPLYAYCDDFQQNLRICSKQVIFILPFPAPKRAPSHCVSIPRYEQCLVIWLESHPKKNKYQKN